MLLRHLTWRLAWLAGPWTWWRAVVVIVVVSAPVVLSYPAAGNWFNDRRHNQVLSGYVEQVTQMGSAEIDAELAAAANYNANLPNGPLRDPYAVDTNGNPVEIGLGKQAYRDMLSDRAGGVMGRVTVPEIGVDLPIYHDTGSDSLDKGVGHLYGSGLPVGGSGVHSVLTAHSGVVGQTLFSNVHKLKMGDTFQVQVLDQVLWYQIDDIRTVLPNDLESLRQQPGRDLVTLLTCTPIGVNTHRLLVTGERIPTPTADQAGATPIAMATPAGPGFPWWLFPAPAVALAAVAFTRNRPRNRLRKDAAGRSDGMARDRPWIETVLRQPDGADFAVWAARRTRAIGNTAAAADANGVVRFADASQAGTYALAAAAEGVHTWTLKHPDGSSIGISAFAFATAEAASANAAHWARHWYQLLSWNTPAGGGHSYWRVGPAETEPVLFQISPGRTDHSAEEARAAIAPLAETGTPVDA